MDDTPAPPSDCSGFTAASITLVLDAPHTTPPAVPLPTNFRSSDDPLPPGSDPKLAAGLKGIHASGSGQYSKGELEAVLASGRVRLPLTLVDLRQESHGLLQVQPMPGAAADIAVSWFLERDWINIGKDLVSIVTDENSRLKRAASTPSLVVQRILTKTPDDRICTVKSVTVKPSAWGTERQLADTLGLEYLRLPTTDHVRPRDSLVDEFVAFERARPRDMWLHFHCRAGDGRTTTFLVMHDIICNAPAVSLAVIAKRQHLLGGLDLFNLPTKPPEIDYYKFPFALERALFVMMFYKYVVEAKSGGFALTWSAWMARGPEIPAAPGSE
jgi:hypothetical protein